MAENIEFIAAKDLPISEADQAYVMCIVNGELMLKKIAPEIEPEYDIKVRFTLTFNEDEGRIDVSAEILSGSYEAVMQKLNDGLIPRAFVVEDVLIPGEGGKAVYEDTPYYQEADTPEYTGLWFDRGLILHEDGTAYLD